MNKMKVLETVRRIETYSKDMKNQMPVNEQTLKNKNKEYIVSFLIQQITNECIGLGNHMISSLDLELPSTTKEIFDILAENGLISKEVAEGMKDFIRVRNLIAHRYAHLKMADLANVANRLEIIESFVDQLVKIK